jgi:predicted small secreted protein
MKRIVQLVLLASILASPLALTGCNTANGAGKDIEKSGEWIQKKTD